jgi:hypothetical protein
VSLRIPNNIPIFQKGSGHYSDSPLLRRPIIPTAHCSDSPFLRQPIIPSKSGTKLTSIQKLCEETGWEKLLERREKQKLILLYKIVNNQAPGYLRNLLPDRVDNLHATVIMCRAFAILGFNTLLKNIQGP